MILRISPLRDNVTNMIYKIKVSKGLNFPDGLFCVDPIIRIMSTPQAAVAGTTKYLMWLQKHQKRMQSRG